MEFFRLSRSLGVALQPTSPPPYPLPQLEQAGHSVYSRFGERVTDVTPMTDLYPYCGACGRHHPLDKPCPDDSPED